MVEPEPGAGWTDLKHPTGCDCCPEKLTMSGDEFKGILSALEALEVKQTKQFSATVASATEASSGEDKHGAFNENANLESQPRTSAMTSNSDLSADARLRRKTLKEQAKAQHKARRAETLAKNVARGGGIVAPDKIARSRALVVPSASRTKGCKSLDHQKEGVAASAEVRMSHRDAVIKVGTATSQALLAHPAYASQRTDAREAGQALLRHMAKGTQTLSMMVVGSEGYSGGGGDVVSGNGIGGRDGGVSNSQGDDVGRGSGGVGTNNGRGGCRDKGDGSSESSPASSETVTESSPVATAVSCQESGELAVWGYVKHKFMKRALLAFDSLHALRPKQKREQVQSNQSSNDQVQPVSGVDNDRKDDDDDHDDNDADGLPRQALWSVIMSAKTVVSVGGGPGNDLFGAWLLYQLCRCEEEDDDESQSFACDECFGVRGCSPTTTAVGISSPVRATPAHHHFSHNMVSREYVCLDFAHEAWAPVVDHLSTILNAKQDYFKAKLKTRTQLFGEGSTEEKREKEEEEREVALAAASPELPTTITTIQSKDTFSCLPCDVSLPLSSVDNRDAAAVLHRAGLVIISYVLTETRGKVIKSFFLSPLFCSSYFISFVCLCAVTCVRTNFVCCVCVCVCVTCVPFFSGTTS